MEKMIRLERTNGKNVWDILKLRVSDAQKSFVAPNDVSIIEAYIAITHHGQAFPFGIYDDETPVPGDHENDRKEEGQFAVPSTNA